ncbi:hypothetical protein SAMN02745945_02582 [Peptoclostridium litorale DSM 5388]|uniref:Protein TrpH n=1 Tax=Peptoclostridium litorale DSM 5388 TaxID=1121324 RepID=A0A069RB98_PEPLI|nr:PHP domain-containing protein [Peptoclostridium litorale]KDR94344.1 protein TrpH [Peptoclostridium litorale DSM 5388]SIO29321.1 hypothetical protein SAMN02745945_02582 [Peptoclostridium litorale DSM 5388]
MKLIDMHIHSTYSDGTYSPKEIVDLSLKKGLYGISITDHDCVDGLPEAVEYCKDKNIIFIPGIEFSCFHNDEEVHILGYNIEWTYAPLLKLCQKLQDARVQRARLIIEKLRNIGFDIDYSDIEKYPANSVGRPHIGQVMVDKGYIGSVSEAFEKYIGSGMAAYVERYKLSVSDAINIIKSAKGLSVIAHPFLISNQDSIDAIARMGIDGLEIYHSSHSRDISKKYKYMAKRLGLIITGGSDFHGRNSDFDFFSNTGIKLDEMDSSLLKGVLLNGLR